MVIGGRFPPSNALLQVNTDNPDTFNRGGAGRRVRHDYRQGTSDKNRLRRADCGRSAGRRSRAWYIDTCDLNASQHWSPRYKDGAG